MSDANHHTRTPARRRPGRQTGRSGGQKAYASENDAGSIDPYGPRHHPVPQTPDKAFYASPSNDADNSKQRSNKSKNKPKNQPSSPEAGHGRQSTPQRPTSMKAGTAAAFAGATFHASPAPSALPMPSFLSKAPMASPTARHDSSAMQEPTPPPTHDTNSPFRRASVASVPRATESPLDFMFRAHRQEQEGQRRGSATEQHPSAAGPASPFVSPFHNSASTGNLPQSAPRPGFSRSQSGIDSAELDGTPGQPIGPAFSTPYQDRIRAAKALHNRPLAGRHDSPQQQPQGESLDPTEALKRYLFSANAPSMTGTGSPKNVRSPPAPLAVENQLPPSRSPHEQPSPARPDQFQAMENDLRRILKINMADPINSDRGPFPH
jgi:hypothetical protein